jgi:hypothetical protein
MILRGVQTEWLADQSQSVNVSSPDSPRELIPSICAGAQLTFRTELEHQGFPPSVSNDRCFPVTRDASCLAVSFPQCR